MTKVGAKNKNERVLIYIDGGNFYKKTKDKKAGLNKKDTIDHSVFVEHIARDRTVVEKRYYIGIVRNVDDTEKSKKMVRGQQKFLSALEKEDFLIKRGRIVYDHSIREKGVDVKIAIDIVIDAIKGAYDTAIVVSSDTDLVPALEYVRSIGKKVEYVGFSHAPSWGMMKNADTRVLLLPDDLKKMVRK